MSLPVKTGRRATFGKKLKDNDNVRQIIARSRIEIDQTRLLVLNAARTIDEFGTKVARNEIAAIKVVAPQVACVVVDRAIQLFGGAGVCQDTFLPYAYVSARTLRLADGPDEVHLETVAKNELAKAYPRL